jgi:hypothetical protein
MPLNGSEPTDPTTGGVDGGRGRCNASPLSEAFAANTPGVLGNRLGLQSPPT